MTFSDKLKLLRKTHGMRQVDLAERMNISAQTISKWENMQKKPDIDQLLSLSKLFGVTIDQLVNDDIELDWNIAAKATSHTEREPNAEINAKPNRVANSNQEQSPSPNSDFVTNQILSMIKNIESLDLDQLKNIRDNLNKLADNRLLSSSHRIKGMLDSSLEAVNTQIFIKEEEIRIERERREEEERIRRQKREYDERVRKENARIARANRKAKVVNFVKAHENSFISVDESTNKIVPSKKLIKTTIISFAIMGCMGFALIALLIKFITPSNADNLYVPSLYCSHEWKDATCDCARICTICGETEGEALPHVWIEATCSDPKYCSLCNTVQGEALGHEWLDATCEQPSTCSLCGKMEGTVLDHTWNEATCTTPKTCSVCATTEGQALGHTPINWTTKIPANCGADGVSTAICNLCSEEIECPIPKTGNHSCGEWVITDEPTCVATGSKEKSCINCNYIEMEHIAALGHTYEMSIVTEATYYAPGKKGEVCSVCNATRGTTTEYYSYFKTTLNNIFSEYEKNELAAAEKYDDMYIEFTAQITNIEAGGLLGKGRVLFEVDNGTWWPDEVQCNIKTNSQAEYVKELAVGKQVTIRGLLRYYSNEELYRFLYIDIIEIS